MELQQQRGIVAGLLFTAGVFSGIGASGGYNLNFNPITEYCLPDTQCQRRDFVDSRIFQSFQEQAARRAEELHKRRLARQNAQKHRRKHQNLPFYGSGLQSELTHLGESAQESWESFAYGTGLNAQKAKHIFSSASTKRFLDVTALARYRGWQLQLWKQRDGNATLRRVLAALCGMSFFGAYWVLQLLEEGQPKLDMEAVIDLDFHEKQYREQKQGAFNLFLEGMAWNLAEAELVLKETFTGLTRRQIARLDAQITNPHLLPSDQEKKTGETTSDPEQPALTGQSLDDITSPKNKVNSSQQRPAPKKAGQHRTIDPVKETWDFIRKWEGGWIVLLLESPVLIWGGQGSFKSYFAAYLALLRYFLKGHTLEIADPHLSLNQRKAWKALLELGIPAVGYKKDYAAVAQRIHSYLRRVDEAEDDKEWYTTIFDEVTQYALKKPTKVLAPELILSCISDARKGKEAPILISHNNTQALLGGVEGAKKALEEGLIQLHLFNTRDTETGEFKPQFRGEITGLTDDSMDFSRITIYPDKMHPEYLLQLFSGADDSTETEEQTLVEPAPESPSKTESGREDEPEDLWQEAIKRLKRSLDASHPSEEPSKTLSEDAEIPTETPEPTSDSENLSESTGGMEPVPPKDSLEVWTFRKVRQVFPEMNPEKVFDRIAESAKLGAKPSDMIREILKCREGREHPTRSYSRHGKTLFRWLIENFDDGTIAKEPRIKEFLHTPE
ncbi:MAG: hypothetical protein KME46_21950 [Brasilonema angustatum HA4187-MV1]|jgi:hypothetical protein|nr:hypothetical protein [Brasilonema angustatum HA4187-MV1]